MAEAAPGERRDLLLWVLVWLFGLALVVAGSVVLAGLLVLSCSGDGGSPYAAPASPMGRLCSFVDDFQAAAYALWLTAPTVAAVGGLVALRRRSGPGMFAAVLGPLALLAVEFVVLVSLPTTCTPDDQSVPGCAHY